MQKRTVPRSASLMSFLCDLWRKQDGVSVIQFAFIAPVFILMLLGGLQVGIVLIVSNALEAAAREASRIAIVSGGAGQAAIIKTEISNIARDRSGGIIDPTKVIVNVKAYGNIENLARPEPFEDANANGTYDIGEVYSDINGNGVWDADQGVTGSFGLGGQAVIYEIQYVWDTLIPILGNSRYVTITARTIVVNEEFPDA